MKKILLIMLLGLLWNNLVLADQKPGRFFEDQPDLEEYNVHNIYLLSKDGKDQEYDVSGYIAKQVEKINNTFFKYTKKNKKSNGEGQKFKIDYTKDGKLDLTFLRLDISEKQLSDLKWDG